MRSALIIVLVSFALVTIAQNNNREAHACLSNCDQNNSQWMACASDCVGLPLTDNDGHDIEDCTYECNDESNDCPSWCDEISSGTKSNERIHVTPTNDSGISEDNPLSATFPDTSGSATYNNAPTQNATMPMVGHGDDNSKPVIAQGVTSTRVSRTPTAFVPQLNESIGIRASFSLGILVIATAIKSYVD